jgi:DNA-binding transcriptional LysR family regulator
MASGADLREIRVFLALADELHFGRAADELGMTTSYASQMLRRLEARVGTRLLDRTSRQVNLTAAGERLLADVRPAYLELERALRIARAAAARLTGTLRVGSYEPVNTGPRWVAIVRDFETRYSECHVEFVHVGLERNYLDVLRSGELDMLAARLPVSDPDITVGPVLSCEPRILAVAVGDPLTQRESVSVEDFADRAVTDVPAFPREMMDAFIPPTTPSGRPVPRIVSRSLDETLMRVAVGGQVHPTVPSWIRYHAHPGITGVPIRDLPPTETALVWLTENASPKIHAMARSATELLAEPGQPQL